MTATLGRTGALAAALAGLYLLMRAMGSGVGTVLVGALVAVAVWAGTLVWSASDARRSPDIRTVVVRWSGVTSLLVVAYVAAALLAPGSYGEDMPVVEIVAQSAVLGVLLFLLPAGLGIYRGSSFRRS